MAQMTGYVCDICEKFSLNRKSWLRLSADSGGSFDICSNRCLVNLGRARVKAEKETESLNPNGNGQQKAPFTTKTMAITDSQKLEVVEEALEIGVKAAADNHGLPWQAVARWKKELQQ